MTIFLKGLNNEQLSSLMEWAAHYEDLTAYAKVVYDELLIRHGYLQEPPVEAQAHDWVPAPGDCGEAPCPLPVEAFNYVHRNPGDGQRS